MMLCTFGNQRKSEFILLFSNAFSSIRPSVPCRQMIQVYNSKAVGAEDVELGTRVRWPVPNVILQIYSLGKVRPERCAVGACMYTCAIMKISITSGKYDLKIPTSFGERSFAIRQKC